MHKYSPQTPQTPPQDNSKKRSQNVWITVFVILWTLIFYYESTRYFYLNPFFGRELPKIKFLFPPAGWIMFYNVDDSYGTAEVFGVRGDQKFFIDPHKIFETKAVGYDNIHRNILVTVLSSYRKRDFCRFLKRKFPGFDGFIVTESYYPSVTKTFDKKLYQVMYLCR